MRCVSCQHENPGRAKFCQECGTRLALRCASCGVELPSAAKFCHECGTSVSQAAPERDPRVYTPKHLADKILTQKSAIEGERKQVTVLFADVKGSMDLTEGADPEQWHRIMDRFFAIMSEGVHRFEGTINQFTGDGIMALFGAPIAHEDHAQRACYAALHLTQELRTYADELRLRGLNFSVRMGINSGEVVVGKIGDNLRMDYTAQGHTVGLAARMEQIAESGRVYLTEQTSQLVEGFFELRDLGRLDVPGVREPMGVYELQGLGARRTRLDTSRARGLSKLVGRTDEMGALEAALERATRGNAQVVGVVAEAGAGKSRLCFEIAERCRTLGIPVYEGHGLPHGRAIPFLPVLEILRAYFWILTQDSDEMIRDKIAGRSVRLDAELSNALPLLFEFLGVPDPEEPLPPMDPEARQAQLFRVIRQLIHARSKREPGLLVLEDLHWLDTGSEAFLEALVESVPGTRTLLLVNFRPEYHAGWMQKSYYQQLALLPLGPEAIAELLRELLGREPELTELSQLIQARTGGNPFFVEEVVQSLVEAGSLEGTRGAYHLLEPVAEVAVPGTVQVVLAARIDRLPEREKQLLQTAAVIGKKFPEPVLERVAELPDLDRAETLSSLISAEFVYEEALYPVAEYSFKHPLTQEVAYNSQLAERRGRIHAAVARALEEIHAEKLDEQAALLAHHWEAAGDALRAARWHRRAARWAGVNHPGEALRHWRRARELLDSLPDSEETRAFGVEARGQMILGILRVGASYDEVPTLVSEAKELASRSGDQRAFAGLLQTYGFFMTLTGRPTEGIQFLEESLEYAKQTGEPALELASQHPLALTYSMAGRPRQALVHIERGFELAGGDLDLGAESVGYSPSLNLLSMRSWSYTLMGRLSEAAHDVEQCVGQARERDEWFPLSFGHSMYVGLCEFSGDAAAALAHAREAVTWAERTGNAPLRTLAHTRLGNALALNERWEEARSAFEHALSLRRENRRFFVADIIAGLARAYLELGEPDKARSAAEEAVETAERFGTRGRIEGHLALAQVLRRTVGAAATREIETQLERVLELVEDTGARGFLPFAQLERAELARLHGEDEQRQRWLREAHRLFVEFGATGHAERLAQELSP